MQNHLIIRNTTKETDISALLACKTIIKLRLITHAHTDTHTHSYLVIRNSGKWAIMEGCLTPVCSTL